MGCVCGSSFSDYNQFCSVCGTKVYRKCECGAVNFIYNKLCGACGKKNPIYNSKSSR